MSKEAAEDASDNKVADSSPSGVCAEAVVVTVSGVTTIEPATKITETHSNGGRVRVLIGILVGDFLHNLCDGIFIGAAFAFCGSSTGWSVAISTVVHETAQEISDFMLLTSPSAGNLTPVRALALNFLSGFPTLFGVLIITYNDVSDVAVGLILAFGAGVYIYVAACECMPRVHEAAKTVTVRLGCILVFIIGAVCIALVLLDHEHCTVTGSHDGHAH